MRPAAAEAVPVLEIRPEGTPGTELRGVDRRKSPRVQTLARAARLIALGDTGLCRVQDLSNGGTSIETSIETFCGDPVNISFDSKTKVDGRVVWRAGKRTGIRFSRPVDACSLIGQLATDRPSAAARPPRLPVNARAQVVTEFGSMPVIVGNISQKGMKLCHASQLASGMVVQVSLARGIAARGRVRWSDANFAGVEFFGMLSVEELASAKLV